MVVDSRSRRTQNEIPWLSSRSVSVQMCAQNDFQMSVWVTAHHSRRRRCLWWEAESVGTERAAGNRWPFLSESLPRNIGQSRQGDNTFTAPTGRLKPIGRLVEKPVVTGHLGRGWRRLSLGPGQTCKQSSLTVTVVMEKHRGRAALHNMTEWLAVAAVP